MKRQLTIEDLDRIFGPGPTVDKASILAALDGQNHVDSTVARRIFCGPAFSLTNDEVLEAAEKLRAVRRLTGEALLSLTATQTALRELQLAVCGSPILDTVLDWLVDKPETSSPMASSALDGKNVSESTANPDTDDAPTIEQLRSRATGYATDFEEDVVLKGEHVFYESGRPFDGVLTRRQIDLLGMAKRLLAPARRSTPSRTAHQFVKLADDL